MKSVWKLVGLLVLGGLLVAACAAPEPIVQTVIVESEVQVEVEVDVGVGVGLGHGGRQGAWQVVVYSVHDVRAVQRDPPDPPVFFVEHFIHLQPSPP